MPSCFSVSIKFLRKDFEFREKGGDVATEDMHVAEATCVAEPLRRCDVSSKVQGGLPKCYGETLISVTA